MTKTLIYSIFEKQNIFIWGFVYAIKCALFCLFVFSNVYRNSSLVAAWHGACVHHQTKTMLQRCTDKKNTTFPVCCCLEMHYLLSAVAGRRQDERPSIRPQNKVKRVRFIPDLIPGCAKNPPSPVNKYSAGRRRERNPLRPIHKPNNLQPATF